MQFLIISILCSVTVSILLKQARKYNVHVVQAVAVNYLVAILCSWYFLQPDLRHLPHDGLNWVLFLALGILFPLGFLVLARAIVHAGMVKADAAQRLSLFLPILAAFVLFNEVLTTNKIVGVVLAFMALLGLLYKPAPASAKGKKNKAQSGGWQTGGWLLAVWGCYGCVDVILKLLAKKGSSFPSILLVAFILSSMLIFGYLLLKRTVWTAASVLAGLALGCLNFANILFYLRAHQAFSTNPTLVFVGMNLGVITLATLVGTILFKEKINGLNAAGIVLAIAALLCLFYWPTIQSWLPAVLVR